MADRERATLGAGETVIRSANLALRFLLELCALAALAYWGFHTGGRFTQITLGIGAPLAAAIVWGLFAAPKAAVRLSRRATFVLGLVVFGVAAAALAGAGHPEMASLFFVVAVINGTLLYIWDQ